MKYPAKFEPAPEGGYVVTFRDVPEAITQGDDEIDAFEMAADALGSSIEWYLEENREVPKPSARQQDERMVVLSEAIAAEVERRRAAAQGTIST